jgi:hypothetical protein
MENNAKNLDRHVLDCKVRFSSKDQIKIAENLSKFFAKVLKLV